MVNMPFGNLAPRQPGHPAGHPESVPIPRSMRPEIAEGAESRRCVVAAAQERVRYARDYNAIGSQVPRQSGVANPEIATGQLATGVVVTEPTEQSIIDPRLMYAAYEPFREPYDPVAEAERVARAAAAGAAVSDAYEAGASRQYPDHDQDQDHGYVSAYAVPAEVTPANPEIDAQQVREQIAGIFGTR